MDVLSPFVPILCHSDWPFYRVLSTTWCCLSRPCVVFLACVHRALFLALFLFPGNSLVSSWCDHIMLASLLWQCLTVPSLLQLCWEPTHLFSSLSMKHAESFSVLSPQRPQNVFLHFSWVFSFHSHTSAPTVSLNSEFCPLKNFPRSPGDQARDSGATTQGPFHLNLSDDNGWSRSLDWLGEAPRI